MRRDDVEGFIQRDWGAQERRKRAWWAARLKTDPLHGLRVGAELWKYARTVRPDWPSAEDRARDLAAHRRLCELLKRVDAHHRSR